MSKSKRRRFISRLNIDTGITAGVGLLLLNLFSSLSHVLLAQTAVRKHLDGAGELLPNRSKCSREDETSFIPLTVSIVTQVLSN